MRAPRLILGVSGLLSLFACRGGEGDTGTSGDTGDVAEGICSSEVNGLAFFRTRWETVGTYTFPHLGAGGEGLITSLVIGGDEYQKNFANRGAVIVEFTGAEDEITLELRKFVFADDIDQAEAYFEKTSLWAFATASNPKSPDAMPFEQDCREGWQEGCQVRTYYRGQQQPSRLGADIRVTMPPSYREKLTVTAGEMVLVDNLVLRGTVHIQELPGSVDVSLSSGIATVLVAEDVTPGPTCSADDIEACETYPGGAWSSECPCRDYGSVKVVGDAADITVDIPASLWATVSLENAGPGQSSNGFHCTATMDADPPTVVDEIAYDPLFPWRGLYELNHPSDAAPVGGGFGVRVQALECSAVGYVLDQVEGEECPVPAGMMVEQRGDLRVCSGCLRQ